jgi:transglutaminase-like putative cysteine protease
MRYRIRHTTTYRYRDPVAVSHNLVHLVPMGVPYQRLIQHELAVVPNPATAHDRYDYFGNRIRTFTVQQPHRELVVRAVSEVETFVPRSDEMANTITWETVATRIQAGAQIMSMPGRCPGEFAYDSPLIATSTALAEYARISFTPQRPMVEALHDLNQRIFREFTYETGSTSVATSVAEVLDQRHGVCQDFAQLAIGCLRSLGLAARYVSGYLETTPYPGQERLIGSDASHAWFSAYCPSEHSRDSWVALDPTNNCAAGERHISIAIGRDFGDVSPLKGMILGGGHNEVSVSVDVVPIATPSDARDSEPDDNGIRHTRNDGFAQSQNQG